MKPMGFSAEPEKLGRFRGHLEGQHGAFLTAGEAAGAETTADEWFRGLTGGHWC